MSIPANSRSLTLKDNSSIGFVVGLNAEARLLRQRGLIVETGGGDPAGAAAATQRLIAKDVGAVISFGLAGGLDPALRAGALLIPRSVIDDNEVFFCDTALLEMLGGANSNAVFAGQQIAGSADEKERLFRQSLADAVDLESGAVARIAASAHLPFAVLRAVADPAERDLPPAAMIALSSAGNIKLSSVLLSVLKQPGQITGLLAIARDAAKARATLVGKLKEIT